MGTRGIGDRVMATRAKATSDSAATDSGPQLRLETLGASRMVFGDVTIGAQSGLIFALLLRLVHTPGMAVSRDVLLREFWPTHPDARRRGNLRQALFKLRAIGLRVGLAGEMVELDRAQVAHTFTLDRSLELFERDIVRGDAPFGLFLPGYVANTAELQEWLDVLRERVHGDVRQVLVTALRRRRERADWGGAEALARWLLHLDPLNEDGTLTLAECTMLAGSKTEAIAILDRYLVEIGPNAGDIRLPATQLRRRFTEPTMRRRPSLGAADRHFVGRQDEMAELTLAMRRARWNDGSAVLLHGPPGIGKTRLVTELGKVAQVEGYLQVLIECREPDQQRPLSVFVETLPQLLASPGALGCMPESLAVLKRLVGDDVGRRMDGRPRDTSQAGTTPATHAVDTAFEGDLGLARTTSVRDAFLDVFDAVSAERPIFLCVEDAHWMDADSSQVLSDLVSRVPTLRIFIVATSRLKEVSATTASRLLLNIRSRELSPLTTESLDTLILALAADCAATADQGVRDWLAGASGGNPLMLHSLVSHWIEGGSTESIPATLQGLIDARIRRLSPAALRALQTLSLLGRFATIERVRTVLQLSTFELVDALELLHNDGCVGRSDGAIAPSHDLIVRASVAQLSPLAKRALHSSIGAVLREECRVAPTPALLLEAATHMRSAAESEEALAFLVGFSEVVEQTNEPRRTLEFLAGSDTGPATITDGAVALRNKLQLSLGEYPSALAASVGGLRLPDRTEVLSHEQVDSLLTAVDAAYRADPFVDLAEVSAFLRGCFSCESYAPSIRARAAEIGLVIAANTCDRGLAKHCFRALDLNEIHPRRRDQILLLYHTPFGELEQAVIVTRRILDRAKSEEPTGALANELTRAGIALRILGHFEDAKAAFLCAIQVADAVAAPKLATLAYVHLARIAGDCGDRGQSNQWTAEAARTVADVPLTTDLGYLVAQYCDSAIVDAQYEKAKHYLGEFRRSLQRMPPVRSTAYALALELGVKMLETEHEVPADLLEAAIAKHQATCELGISDFLTAMITEALTRAGRAGQSLAFVETYVTTQRRDRSPISKLLEAAHARAKHASAIA